MFTEANDLRWMYIFDPGLKNNNVNVSKSLRGNIVTNKKVLAVERKMK